MEIIEGRRKHSTLYVYDNFVYTVNRRRGNKIYASCNKSKTCSGRGVIVDDHIAITKAHNHEGDRELINSIRFASTCKMRAETDTARLIDIYNEESERFKNTRISYNTINCIMSKRRRACIPPAPASREEFYELLSKSPFKQTIHGLPFFSAEIKVNENSTVVFISPAVASIINQVTELQIGVTCQVVPSLFHCLCTLHAVAYNSTFPFAFALMTRSSLAEFNLLFQHLRNVLPDLDPSHICTDYNDDLQTSCNRIFHKAVISGSYYSYGQEVWRQATTLGLQPSYRNREPTRKIVGMCLALALLPAHLLAKGLEVIKSLITCIVTDDKLQTELNKLIHYMENQWLSKSVNFSVFGQENRTSNYTHAFHILLKKKFGREVPPLWNFLERLREIEEQQAKDLERLQHGKAVKRPKRHTHILGQRATSQAGDKLLQGKSSVIEYLEAIAEILPEPTDDEIYGLDDWVIQEISECKDSFELPFEKSEQSVDEATTVFSINEGEETNPESKMIQDPV